MYLSILGGVRVVSAKNPSTFWGSSRCGILGLGGWSLDTPTIDPWLREATEEVAEKPKKNPEIFPQKVETVETVEKFLLISGFEGLDFLLDF